MTAAVLAPSFEWPLAWLVAGAARLGPVVADQRAQERAEDRGLVERAQAGDRAALGELFRKHGPQLYRTVLLPRLGSEAAAQDALGETYERVLLKIGQFAWQDVGFYPWMRVVALRVALDQLRARRRVVVWDEETLERELEAASAEEGLDDRVAQAHDADAARRRLADALARIHPRYAEAIRLRVLEELPREEVAARLGATPATFDVLLHRATAALRKALAPDATMLTGSPGSPSKDKSHG